MKLGLQYVVILLIVGIVAGLSLSSFIETPLNPSKEPTTVTDTTTTTITTTTVKDLALWPHSLSFRLSNAGPNNFGYDMSIGVDGFAVVSYHNGGIRGSKTGIANLTLSKGDLDKLSFLLLKANVLHLNQSYDVKRGYFDWGFYDLTLTTNGQTKSVSWAMGDSAVESTPKELHEIEDYLSEIAYRVIP